MAHSSSTGTILIPREQHKMVLGKPSPLSSTLQGKYFVNLTVTDDDGKSSTASVLVEVSAKESEGLFGVDNNRCWWHLE